MTSFGLLCRTDNRSLAEIKVPRIIGCDSCWASYTRTQKLIVECALQAIIQRYNRPDLSICQTVEVVWRSSYGADCVGRIIFLAQSEIGDSRFHVDLRYMHWALKRKNSSYCPDVKLRPVSLLSAVALPIGELPWPPLLRHYFLRVCPSCR